jgi:glycosyltransferase involved in cell wall biosynthesis
VHRILHVEPASVPGGSVASLYYLVRGLDRDLYQPVVLLSPKNPWVDRFRALEAEVLAQDAYRRMGDTEAMKRAKQGAVSRGLRSRRWSGRLYRTAGFWWRILGQTWPQALAMSRLIRQEQIDLVHTNWRLGCDRPGIIGARLAGVPCVAHIRAFEKLTGLDRALSRLVSAYICISRSLEDNLRREGARLQRSAVVYNGLEPSDFKAKDDPAEVKAEFGFGADTPVVAVIGRLDRWKGQGFFLQAMERVLGEFPRARALVVGDPEPYCSDYYRELQSLAESPGLAGKVVFTGYREDTPRLMRGIDVLVHSSSEPEPFGRVIIEGMAMGLPVVATAAGAVPEIVADGITGVLVQPRDPEAMAAAVVDLLGDARRRSQMGRKGRERVEKLFTAQQCVAGVQQVYRRVLGGVQ